MLLPLYLRREPASDGTSGRFDVCAYRDQERTVRAARWMWWSSTKPTRRNRRVTSNCYYWRAVW